MIFRTPAQKSDLEWSWARGDRAFFAAGACHILARAFLTNPIGHGFKPMMIVPGAGFRGGHVFATDGTTVFDYHGFSSHARFLAHYFAKISRIFPGWQGNVLDITDTFWTDDWFDVLQMRRPHQYHRDPSERAAVFVAKMQPKRIREAGQICCSCGREQMGI
ncbi:MAG: hypothetical protein IPN11_08250 [Opitutaceae bacterium]|nr:hypothetical protein [Opitutaceae bacterium]